MEALGHERVLHCELPSGDRVAVRVASHLPVPHEGEPARLAPDLDRLHLFAASDGRRLG